MYIFGGLVKQVRGQTDTKFDRQTLDKTLDTCQSLNPLHSFPGLIACCTSTSSGFAQRANLHNDLNDPFILESG
jgi:hypothetical protein